MGRTDPWINLERKITHQGDDPHVWITIFPYLGEVS
jgi:hypothetical protein